MAAATPPARAPDCVNIFGSLPLIGREQGVLPGSQVLSAKLYGHPDGFDTILVDHLPALLSAWDEPPMWWFVRYRDPDPHLRLRLHLVSGHDYGQAASRVGAWAADLRRRRLIGDLTLDTYHPETARYGSGAALAAAEAVFATDSTAVLAQLAALTASRQVHPPALTAASLVDLTSAVAGSLPAGRRWLIDHPFAHGHGGGVPASNRDVLRQAVDLADLDQEENGGTAALHTIPGGSQIAAVWQARRQAAAGYADRIAADAHNRVKPTLALTSLLHMHHVRAHGIDPEGERDCYRLARAVALAWNASHDTARRSRR